MKSFFLTYSKNWIKRHKILTFISVCVLVFILFVFLNILLVYELHLIPEKSAAKKLTENHIEEKLGKSGYTVIDIEFDIVNAEKFSGPDEDKFGYFNYINRYNKKDADFNEDAKKWAYTLTGTCTAFTDTSPSEKLKFVVIYVKDFHHGNGWIMTKCDIYKESGEKIQFGLSE